MKELYASIAGAAAYLPEDKLTNDDLIKTLDTSDEWIMTRIGIKERRILKGPNKPTSFMAIRAVKELLRKTGKKPEEIDVVICATSTPDHIFPSTASITAEQCGIKKAFCFEVGAACSGFIYAFEVANGLIKTGRYRNIIVIGAEKMSTMVDYTERSTAPIFGDGAAAVLIVPCEEQYGLIDSILETDGMGLPHLQMKAGGSAYPASNDTVAKKEHNIYQEGPIVFKYAVSRMADYSAELIRRNNLTNKDISWLIPHQANVRIIDAVAKRCQMPQEKVIVNIDHVGNTSAASIPICIAEYEKKFKKGDIILMAAFGAGFTYGASLIRWAYDTE